MRDGGFDEESWRQRLRAARLRVTRIRLDVLRALWNAGGPINAHEALAAMPHGAADRVTVYRTLGSLVEAGLAHRVDPGDRVWRFSLTAEGHGQHPHLVCDSCGAVECVENATIRVAFDERHADRPVRITQSDVYLHGACDECARTEPPRARSARNDTDPPRGPHPARKGR